MSGIRVLTCDDEPLVRAGLRALVSAEPDLEVVGEAGDGAEAVSRARVVHPQVVLMDVRMPRVDGIAATRLLTAWPEPPAVVVVTTFENDEFVYDALLAGARGFLLKRAPAAEIVAAVRHAATSEAILFPARLADLVSARPAAPARAVPQLARLTDREQDVLRLMARGLSNAEIASALHLGGETVKSHVRAVLARLEVRDRTQAVIRAYEGGFVSRGR